MAQKTKALFCNLCRNNLPIGQSLIEHYSNTHSEYITYHCTACKRSFPHIIALNQHLQSSKHHHFEPKGANLHNKFHRDSAIVTKIQTTSEIKSLDYFCGICQRVFHAERSRRQHFQAVHKTHLELLLKCSICQSTVYSYLQKNIRFFFCYTCQKIIELPTPIKYASNKPSSPVFLHQQCPPHEYMQEAVLVGFGPGNGGEQRKDMEMAERCIHCGKSRFDIEHQ
jgi:RNase P subunit RPR2